MLLSMGKLAQTITRKLQGTGREAGPTNLRAIRRAWVIGEGKTRRERQTSGPTERRGGQLTGQKTDWAV